jgi:hypothetical protein
VTPVRPLIGRRALLASAAWVALIGSPIVAGAQERISSEEAQDIAVEAYIYLYPMVTMGITRQQTNAIPGAAPNSLSNRFVHMREFPAADFKLVVGSNFDTLYSTAWPDITKGPVIVSVPDTAGRYYVLPMLDMWTDVFAAPGKRTSRTKAGRFAIIPPGWSGKLPKGVTHIDTPTPYVWIVGRTQTNGPQDYAAVRKIQDGYTVTPLSQWAHAPTSVQAAISAPTNSTAPPPREQVDRMAPFAFFTHAAELMKANPPHFTDWSMIERLKRIGIEVGHSYHPEQLDSTIQEALTRAASEGEKRMQARAADLGRLADDYRLDRGSWQRLPAARRHRANPADREPA